jgi:hypothetical protein
MDLKGFVDKAKEAAAAVTEQAKTAMTTSALPQVGPPENIEATAAGQGTDLVAADGAPLPQGKTLATITSEALTQMGSVGAAKIQELVTAFQQALPAIKSAGYELTEFEIELGVTPKLIPHFRHAAKSAEDANAAREALRDNKVGLLVLGALLKAGDVHRQINVAGFCFSHIEIEMGLIPSVRLQYKNDALPNG